MTLTGACVQATVFGQFAHLISSLDSQATQFKRQLSSIVDSMSYHGFPESLRVSARCLSFLDPRMRVVDVYYVRGLARERKGGVVCLDWRA